MVVFDEMGKKMTLPPEALAFFQETGRIGGKAKVKKGFAAMDESAIRKVQAKALKTRRRNAAAKKAAAKKNGGKLK